MCIEGNPKLCPKPCPSVSFCLNPIEIPFSSQKDEEEDGISSCEEQTQPVKSLSTSEVESENLSESDIDPFETMYGEMDEDSFHQMMEGNDWTYYPLFSDKEFLNEDWHKYTCIESCAAIGNARHGCESLGTDIQSIREIDDSGSTLLSEIGNMMTNITGSSILKSTGHTSQVKPGKLSVRFILSDREPCSDNPSSEFERTSDSEQSEVVSADESEIGIVSELEDDWYSCESSDDEDECFYDAVSLVNSHDASLSSLPHQVTETPCETNLDGWCWVSWVSSPIMLIPRKLTGIPRIVTDFRHLNSRLVTLQPSIPLVRDAIQILGNSGAEVLSLADLRDAYHTLRLSKKSQKYCGITPYYGSDSYLYQRLGMGLSVSPAIWQNFIQKVLQEIPDYRKSHLAIMDDILTYSKRADHTGKLIDLFKAVIRNGLKMSPRKCKLFKKSLVFMGLTMMIEDGMAKMKPLKSRIEAILKVKPPTTVKECRSFCGMVNYMSIFLPSLQEKLIPIYFITRKGVPFYWGDEQQKAFDSIKQDVTNAPVLLMPNATGHFVLVSDTSKIGCGAALYQKQKGKYHLIAYYSKKLPEAVERYSISELELTGVMANVVAFKHLLRNANFHVYCDHSALVHILKAKRELPTLRLKKLIENLSEYKFDIYFLKGKEMHISDFLSRHPDDEDSPNEIIPIAFMLRELEKPDFPENFLYLKEEVDALPEQENYEPYHENDFS